MKIVCSTCGKEWAQETNKFSPDCKCGEKCTDCIGGNANAYHETRNGVLVQMSSGYQECHVCNGHGVIAPTPRFEG